MFFKDYDEFASFTNSDWIELRKKAKSILNKAKTVSKPTNCILCNKPISSCCNSHSVPQMVLKNIETEGEVLSANSVVGVEIIDTIDGVNRSGTFHFICNQCDSLYFQKYENERNLIEDTSDVLLAEIGLKNILLQLSKRREELALIDILEEMMGRNPYLESERIAKKLDEMEYLESLYIYKNIIDIKSLDNNFNIIYRELLPYRVPIATQSAVAMQTDMEGFGINDVRNYSPSVRMENLQLCIFPLEKSTLVMLFSHRRNKGYRRLRRQFNSISEKESLEYINWLVFKYTENYYFSPQIKKIIDSNPLLQKLGQDNYGVPHLGVINNRQMLKEYREVKPNELPNFLDKKYELLSPKNKVENVAQ